MEKNIAKGIKYMKSLPFDVQMMILSMFDLDKFVIVCDMLEIDINNVIRNIMESYSYHDFINMNTKIDVVSKARVNIKTKINGSTKFIDKYKNHYAYDNVSSLKDLEKIKNKVENKIKVYWINFSYLFYCEPNELNKNSFFEGLTSIEFCGDFNQEIDGILPKTLKFLSFKKSKFNKSVNNLPENLKELIFEGKFNQPVDYLPKSLTKLILPENFNQSIDKLPKSLKYLELSANFNQPINKLPPYLTHLIFTEYMLTIYNKPLDDILPTSLIKLRLSDKFNLFINFERLTNLTYLRLNNYLSTITELPPNLTNLILDGKNTYDININDVRLPPNLEYLKINQGINQYVEHWPQNLKKLEFGAKSEFNKNIDNLPDSLVELILGRNFNQEIKHWPSNLEILQFEEFSDYNQPLKKISPSVKLNVGQRFRGKFQ